MTMPPIDCRMCKPKNLWHSVYAHINHIETAFVHTTIICNESDTHSWHPILRLYVLSFASRSLVSFQCLLNCYPHCLSERWHGPITFPRFRPAIYGMSIVSLIFGKYISSSSPFLIELLLLDFHDAPCANSNISTLFMRSVLRVLQLDTWMNGAWWSCLRQIRHEHRLHFLWHVWHHSIKFG